MNKEQVPALIRLFARHRVAANLLMLLMIVVGVFSIYRINVQTLPTFTPAFVTVTIIWPGATAEDVEMSITNPLEQEFRDLDNLKRLFSQSSESRSTVYLEFFQGTDMGEAQENVRERVDRVRNLPQEAEKPMITRMEPYETIAKLIITGPDDLNEIRPLIHRFERELYDAGIEKVTTIGLPDQEIAIQIPITTLIELKTSLPQIAEFIAQQSRDVPAGSIGEGELTRQLRTLEQGRTLRDFEALAIIHDPRGQEIRLADIAEIRLRPQDGTTLAFYQGKPAVEMRLQRHENTHSFVAAEHIHQWLDATRKELGESINIMIYDERWHLIKERVNLLLKNAASGLVLIIIVLFLLLNRQVAFWVIVGIPTSFLAALGVLALMGGTINMVSLFAFIMTLGIIVDDTIVVGEQAATNMRHSKLPINAIESAVQKMLRPVTAASLTTICAFFPLLFIGEEIGEIIFDIPFVVICVIIASLLECFFVLPGHLHHSFNRSIEKKPSTLRRRLSINFELFKKRRFLPIVHYALANRGITLASAFSLFFFSLALVVGGYINFSFFPSPETQSLVSNVRFTIGTPSDKIYGFLQQVEKALYETSEELSEPKHPLVTHSIIFQNRTQLSDYQINYGKHYASIYVELISPDQRDVSNQTFIDHWRSKILLPPCVESFALFQPLLGPPGEDIDIELTGSDPIVLKQAAIALKDRLASFVGVSDVEDDLPFGQDQLIFKLTPTGEAVGLTVDAIGEQLFAGFHGKLAQIFYDAFEEIEVRVTLPDEERNYLHTLDHFPIITPAGDVVPLDTVAHYTFRQAPNVLLHSNTQLAVQIKAKVNEKVTNANKVLAAVSKDFLPNLAKQYDVTYELRGKAEEQKETLADMRFGLLLGLSLIYIVLAWVFNSYTWPILILITIPLGLTGAIFGHFIMRLDLTIMSLFGFFGLAGIVINDSIILMNEYHRLTMVGVAKTKAIVNACSLRFRAVLLTSLTTIAGLTPLLFERSLQAQFLIPMAVSIVFGLIFSTLLILLVVPSLLSVYEEGTLKLKRLVTKLYPLRQG